MVLVVAVVMALLPTAGKKSPVLSLAQLQASLPWDWEIRDSMANEVGRACTSLPSSSDPPPKQTEVSPVFMAIAELAQPSVVVMNAVYTFDSPASARAAMQTVDTDSVAACHRAGARYSEWGEPEARQVGVSDSIAFEVSGTDQVGDGATDSYVIAIQHGDRLAIIATDLSADLLPDADAITFNNYLVAIIEYVADNL